MYSCAEGIGAVARIVSQETTCTVLLQVFDELSEQEPWGVRKSCVDSFLDVARNVTPEIRENQLCDAIQRLAEDSSRWVRAEAWRVLGPFIYTFTSTNKSLAASASTEEIADTESTADKTASLESIEEQATLDVAALERKMEDISVSESTETPSLADKDKLGFSGSPPTSPKVRPPEITVTAHGSDGSGGESDASAGETTDEGGVTIEVSDISEANATEEEDESSDNAFQPQAQIHVPERIINLYKSMASVQNKKAATTLDGDMVFHCAYNFPAVLLALGPGMWPSFAPMYNTLVDDLQWNVRSTLAHSIHEIAKIIGREKAETDLVPTFSKFLNDMDEVKTGVVKHFVEFISCLSETKRLSYLYQLDEIVLTSNKHNWRYKVLFIEQLANMCDIFTPEELMDDDGAFAHLVLRLAEDDIYSVREAAYDSLGKLFNKLYMTGKDELYADVSNAILHDFLQSKSSIYRQK
ncbi:hypothetical protein, variant [Sphaeroforma arctica JP610]|uniref:Uncharacterized protein n=1 Tax=Sphaeroforma arctica JP610 TaxID=667725 RepID=A0A0L0GAT4_9EUKA|nr:hypothetical protein, variant [Sphaeroforma arctica JP610]KNC86085.1 hypothetical protein, variant [Sphaeroforma arctica JP610]|eukprot:XP_014159988.1 hypothetical protein, variant [Sphaeroforma arctica JP610]